MKITIAGKSIWVNYHHLYCFYCVVRFGGLSKASREIGIGQSALSIQLKHLEEQLGFPLFERAGRSLALNERGKIVLVYAKEIFRLGTEMIEVINDRPTARRLHLQLGILDSIPKHLTVQIVREVFRGSTDATVSVREGRPEDLFKDLGEFRIDLVVANSLPSVESVKLYSKRIARMPLWVVGTKKFYGLRKGFPGSIQKMPFIVPTSDSTVRHEFDSFCRSANIAIDCVAEVQDMMVQKLLALNELGLTVLPEFAVREYLEKKQLFMVGQLGGAYEELFLVFASRKLENPLASNLLSSFQIK